MPHLHYTILPVALEFFTLGFELILGSPAIVPPSVLLQQQQLQQQQLYDANQADRYNEDAAFQARPFYGKGRQQFDARNAYAGYQNDQVCSFKVFIMINAYAGYQNDPGLLL